MLGKILHHLSGQGLVLFVNVAVGVLFVRWLPIEAYGFYILGTVLQAVACAFSDFGITNGMNILVARNQSDRRAQAAILLAAWKFRKKLIPVALLSALLLAGFLLDVQVLGAIQMGGIVGIAIVSGILQSKLNISKSLLNASHDAGGLLRVGLAECCTRMALVPACLWFPAAGTALAVNAIALLVAWGYIARYSPESSAPAVDAEAFGEQIKGFVTPLMPSVVYSVIQGHLGVCILGFVGATGMVAETGALGRLGQLIGIILVLNPFWVQPYFARIDCTRRLGADIVRVVAILIGGGGALVFSSCVYPEVWLWLLGDNYSSTTRELPWAVLSAVTNCANSVLYTIVLARNVTRGQTWCVTLGAGFQVLYVGLVGVNSTIDALLLGMLPAFGSILVQSAVLVSLMSPSGRQQR